MGLLYLKRIAWLAGLILLQVLVLNHIHIGGVATPFLYVYFLLVLNQDINRYALLLLGFVLGLATDVFLDTPGINAAASTLLAFVRPFLLHLFISRDSAEDMEPGLRTMGIGAFSGYVMSALFVHHATLLLIETFSLFDGVALLIKILSSMLLTYGCVIAVEYIRKNSKKSHAEL